MASRDALEALDAWYHQARLSRLHHPSPDRYLEVAFDYSATPVQLPVTGAEKSTPGLTVLELVEYVVQDAAVTGARPTYPTLRLELTGKSSQTTNTLVASDTAGERAQAGGFIPLRLGASGATTSVEVGTSDARHALVFQNSSVPFHLQARLTAPDGTVPSGLFGRVWLLFRVRSLESASGHEDYRRPVTKENWMSAY